MTPLQVRQPSLPLAKLRGYERVETDTFLKRVAADYEAVWMEREGLKKRLAEVESQLHAQREREALVADALITAERGAAEIRAAASEQAAALRAEAELAAQEIRQDADAEARALIGEAQTMRRRLEEEAAHELERHETEVERLQRLSQETRENLSNLLIDTLQRAGIDVGRLAELEPTRPSAD